MERPCLDEDNFLMQNDPHTEIESLGCNSTIICDVQIKQEGIDDITEKEQDLTRISDDADVDVTIALDELDVKVNTLDFSENECSDKIVKSESMVPKSKESVQESFEYCSECVFQAWDKKDLLVHLRIHNGEKPYECSECNYRTGRKNDLLRHMRTHTGEKPYHCSVCDYQTVESSHLMRHMRTHTGERPFKCNECDYRAGRKSHLIRHMISHTSGRFYQCSVCDYRAKRKGDFLSHMGTHTVMKSYQCSEVNVNIGRFGEAIY